LLPQRPQKATPGGTGAPHWGQKIFRTVGAIAGGAGAPAGGTSVVRGTAPSCGSSAPHAAHTLPCPSFGRPHFGQFATLSSFAGRGSPLATHEHYPRPAAIAPVRRGVRP
jgi:hypothetical protein